MWLKLLIIAIVAGAAIGYFTSGKENKKEAAVAGAVTTGMGCVYILIRIFIFGAIIFVILSLFKFLFL